MATTFQWTTTIGRPPSFGALCTLGWGRGRPRAASCTRRAAARRLPNARAAPGCHPSAFLRTGAAPLVVTSVTLRLSCSVGSAALQVALFNTGADRSPTTVLTAWADGAYPSTCGDGAPYSAVSVAVAPVVLAVDGTYALVGRTAGWFTWGSSYSDLDAAAAAAASGWASLAAAKSEDAGALGGALRCWWLGCTHRAANRHCDARPRQRP